jgi:cell division transport system permease protein
MRISYSISQVFRGINARRGSDLILVLCIACSFLVFGSFLLITQNLKGVEQRLKGEVKIEVYLNEDINPLELHLLRQSIKRLKQVEKVEYRSQSEALVQLGDYFGKDLLQGLESNPLPASFLLGLKREYRKFEHVAEVVSRIKGKKGVEDVEFGSAWLKKLDRAIFIFFVVDIIFGIFIGTAVIMILSNFMRMAVLSQAESIQIMSLMGASRGDISLPLLIQGLLLGGAGASLGVLFLWASYLIFRGMIIGVQFLPFQITLGLIAWGMVLGAWGSFLSIRRHLQNRS